MKKHTFDFSVKFSRWDANMLKSFIISNDYPNDQNPEQSIKELIRQGFINIIITEAGEPNAPAKPLSEWTIKESAAHIVRKHPVYVQAWRLIQHIGGKSYYNKMIKTAIYRVLHKRAWFIIKSRPDYLAQVLAG